MRIGFCKLTGSKIWKLFSIGSSLTNLCRKSVEKMMIFFLRTVVPRSSNCRRFTHELRSFCTTDLIIIQVLGFSS